MNIPFRVSDDKKYLVVAEDTVVEWEYKDWTFRRMIPEGYRARPGASVETILLIALTFCPYALVQASVLHDYLYDEMEVSPDLAVPRYVADAAMLADEDDPRWIAKAAYWVVRVVGFIPWIDGT